MKITDSYLVAALMSKGYVPRERVIEDRTVGFIFDDGFDLSQEVEDYKLGRMEITANVYADSIRAVKGLVWEMKDA